MLVFYYYHCIISIDALTGEITRNSSVTLDREVTPEFQLTIEVTDGGNPPKSTNGTVFIEIQASTC